jgi:hypothetical protein
VQAVRGGAARRNAVHGWCWRGKELHDGWGSAVSEINIEEGVGPAQEKWAKRSS